MYYILEKYDHIHGSCVYSIHDNYTFLSVLFSHLLRAIICLLRLAHYVLRTLNLTTYHGTITLSMNHPWNAREYKNKPLPCVRTYPPFLVLFPPSRSTLSFSFLFFLCFLILFCPMDFLKSMCSCDAHGNDRRCRCRRDSWKKTTSLCFICFRAYKTLRDDVTTVTLSH